MGIELEFAEENFVRSTKRANQARVLARSLAPQLRQLFPQLFTRVPSVTAVSDQGWYNLTLFVGAHPNNPEYVLRLAARSALPVGQTSRSLPHLEKERYILDQLRSFDFVARTTDDATGRCVVSIPGKGDVEYGYLLQTCMPFRDARAVKSSLDRNRYLWQLGEILRAIQSVVVTGFGTEFDEGRGGFAADSFHGSLTSYIRTIEEAPIAPSMRKWLSVRLESLLKLDPEPRLYHKDLLGNLGNFLVDDTGNVRAVIDWEFAGSGLAFHSELASFLYVLVRDGHSQESIRADRNAVLGGYGITEKQYHVHYERDVETLVLMHSLAALIKYEVLSRKGELTQEPWRKVFAERADSLCSVTFAKDAPRKAVRAKHTA